MLHRALLLALLIASSPAAAGSDLPNRAELLAALNALEACGGPGGPDCGGPTSRQYRVHGAHCMKIAPVDGRAAAACRVDLSLVYKDSERNTRYHDDCARFVRRGGGGDGPGWEVLQIRDRPCEMRSRLKRDPNPEPGFAQMERALIGMLTCYDPDGVTDCFAQPTEAQVESMHCKPIAPGPGKEVRVACRVTASIPYSSSLRPQRLTDQCIRLERTTERDVSPAHWVAIYVPREIRCEVH